MRKFITMAKMTRDTTVNQSSPVPPQPEEKVIEEKVVEKPIEKPISKKTTNKKINERPS
jgi:hypothetical protein